MVRGHKEGNIVAAQRERGKNQKISNLEKLQIDGFKIVTEEMELMKMVKGNSSNRYDYSIIVPAGFEKYARVCEALDASATTIRPYLRLFEKSYPASVVKKGMVTFVDPEMFGKFIKDKYNLIPEGFENLPEMCKGIGYTYVTLLPLARKFEELNPEFVKRHGQVKYFKKAEFEKFLGEKGYNIKVIPTEKFVPKNTIAKEIGMHSRIKELEEKIEQFEKIDKNAVVRKGKSIYLDSDKFKRFLEDSGTIIKIPDGFKLLAKVQKEFSLTYSQMSQYVKRFNKENPNMTFKRGFNYIHEGKFKEFMEKNMTTKKFETITQISKKMGVSPITIRSNLPEFEEKNKGSVIRKGAWIFCDSEKLIAFLEEIYKAIPSNYVTLTRAGKPFGLDSSMLRGYAQQLEKAHPNSLINRGETTYCDPIKFAEFLRGKHDLLSKEDASKSAITKNMSSHFNTMIPYFNNFEKAHPEYVKKRGKHIYYNQIEFNKFFKATKGA